MAYADYTYYIAEFSHDPEEPIPGLEFDRWEHQAELEMEIRTAGRVTPYGASSNAVKDCVCAIAELLYKIDVQTREYRKQGLAGPLYSWSNDGQSGTVDLKQSIYTQQGKAREISRLCRLYLAHTGLLYMGVTHYES